MPEYVLTYFNSRGLAEIARLVLAAAEVPYEDKRVQREQWLEIKPTTPLGHLPILEIDGKVTLSESDTITRYLARVHGFIGKDELETARIDMIAASFKDVMMGVAGFIRESDAAKKEQLKQKFISETIPPFLTFLEKLLKSNNNGEGFLVGDKLSYADLTAYHIFSQISPLNPSLLEGFPCLKGHKERIGSIPSIKAWVEKRPKTEF